jgi:oligopeptide/dipeptide ABC transporter ATP-binding protein
MYLGKIVEIADRDELFKSPLHPYTRALLASIPIPNPEIRPAEDRVLQGDIPSPSNPPKGCRFHTRCPLVEDRCRVDAPEFKEVSPGHWAACHLT